MSCEACARPRSGLYDFACRRCEARAYVVAPEKHQRITRARWRAVMTPEEIAEMQRLVEDVRKAKGEN